jgi:hypothetical protein
MARQSIRHSQNTRNTINTEILLTQPQPRLIFFAVTKTTQPLTDNFSIHTVYLVISGFKTSKSYIKVITNYRSAEL